MAFLRFLRFLRELKKNYFFSLFCPRLFVTLTSPMLLSFGKTNKNKLLFGFSLTYP